MVSFDINDSVSSVTGVRPLDAKFFSQEGPYVSWPDTLDAGQITHEALRKLDEDLKQLREVSRKRQLQ